MASSNGGEGEAVRSPNMSKVDMREQGDHNMPGVAVQPALSSAKGGQMATLFLKKFLNF